MFKPKQKCTQLIRNISLLIWMAEDFVTDEEES